eukprot:TRINITY_DN44788_c0_g1_i1.p1 TRINITY_DN44788_c0_g1~~TRINITY_DN44788_c0_g1_i1.p1  ORF type:complete len:207 (-),score=15.72 TRINITY_DN44788_c0_g1_i1:90-710(-)
MTVAHPTYNFQTLARLSGGLHLPQTELSQMDLEWKEYDRCVKNAIQRVKASGKNAGIIPLLQRRKACVQVKFRSFNSLSEFYKDNDRIHAHQEDELSSNSAASDPLLVGFSGLKNRKSTDPATPKEVSRDADLQILAWVEKNWSHVDHFCWVCEWGKLTTEQQKLENTTHIDPGVAKAITNILRQQTLHPNKMLGQGGTITDAHPM